MSAEWQTDAFRQSMVKKLDETIRDTNAPYKNANALQLESQLFQRAQSRDEYFNFIAKCIIVIIRRSRLGQDQQIVGMQQQLQQGPQVSPWLL